MTEDRIDWIANCHCPSGVAYPHDVKQAIKAALREASAPTQGADARPVASDMRDAYVGAREDLLDWKRRALKAEELNRKFIRETNGPVHMGEPVIANRDAAPSDAPNAWADLWYFVMDEAPMEFERIVTTVSPSQWHSEAHKLMRAKYPIAPREKT